jgi:hypothetical protein
MDPRCGPEYERAAGDQGREQSWLGPQLFGFPFAEFNVVVVGFASFMASHFDVEGFQTLGPMAATPFLQVSSGETFAIVLAQNFDNSRLILPGACGAKGQRRPDLAMNSISALNGSPTRQPMQNSMKFGHVDSPLPDSLLATHHWLCPIRSASWRCVKPAFFRIPRRNDGTFS